jgi:hypothetical protein
VKERHLLALSGGKDSAALAVYMREKYSHLPMEYVFIDSGCELPETYAYLDKLRAILGIEIVTIGGASKQDRKDFRWWLKQKNYYLPSPRNRWCTEVLKLTPYSRWLQKECGDTVVHSYVGLRADEKRERTGFTSCHVHLVQHHPFIDDGLVYNDIKLILENSGIGFPDYYEWRSRSGCYFCFYQSKREWVALYRRYPSLFIAAAEMEKIDQKTGKQFSWNEGVFLLELIAKAEEIENASNDFVHGLDKSPKLLTLLESTSETDASLMPCDFIKERLK